MRYQMAVTPAQQMIFDVVEAAEGPLSAAEVLAELKDHKRTPGNPTVYRALNAGADTARLTAVTLPGDDTTRYEPADRGHHHHFACTQCERVVDVVGCPGRLSPLVPDGFTLTGHDLTLYGLCDACA